MFIPMTTTQARKMLRSLEVQIEALKRQMMRSPDEATDVKNWERVRGAVKRSRKATFRKWYGKT